MVKTITHIDTFMFPRINSWVDKDKNNIVTAHDFNRENIKMELIITAHDFNRGGNKNKQYINHFNDLKRGLIK